MHVKLDRKVLIVKKSSPNGNPNVAIFYLSLFLYFVKFGVHLATHLDYDYGKAKCVKYSKVGEIFRNTENEVPCGCRFA